MPDYSIDRYHFALTNQQINGNWVYVCKYKNPDGTFATFNSTVQPDDHIVGLMLDAGLSSFLYRATDGEQNIKSQYHGAQGDRMGLSPASVWRVLHLHSWK
jgi:hypothetical protein